VTPFMVPRVPHFFGGNGVAVSTDSGATFVFINISTLKTESRYGAFPSAKVWYISAGEWPDNDDGDTNDRITNNQKNNNHKKSFQLTKRITVGGDKHSQYSVTMNERNGDIIDNGWKAQIVKTTDGGVTWTSLFFDEGNFYFNQIDCADSEHCCAVGEADQSSLPGIRIYCTDDGTTFNQVFFNGDADYSIMAIQSISLLEYWASGGDMSPGGFNGYFWHTTDGGKTWQAQTIPGVYGNAMSFPSENVGFATGFDELSTSVFMKYA